MINKRGDITTQQIVLLIILIASFAVILFFIFRLNLGATTAKEVCHNSVITRGASVLPGESVPLNCKTTYVCITQDGSCENSAGSFEKKKVATSDEVYDLLANEMADCWWMFGEGKINYIGKEFLSERYCSICSQINFDNSIKEKIFESGEITQKTFYEYLAKINVSNKGISYLEYLYGLNSVQKMEESLKSKNSDFGKITLEKQYYIVMGISSKVGAEGWAVAGGIAGAILGGPIGIIIGAVAGGVGGPMLGTVVQGEDKAYLSPTIIEANSAAFDSLQCASIKTLA